MVLGCVTAAAAAKVVAGLVALAVVGDIAAENTAGLPRWLPHAMSLNLAAVAVVTWAPRVAQAALATFWALAAAAFARPASVAVGWPDVRVEPLLVLVGVGCGLLATARYPWRLRLALLAPPALVVVEALVLMIPYPSGAASAADAVALTLILAAAYGLRPHSQRRLA